MKNFLKKTAIIILVLILFRGFIYRLLIKYEDIGTRTEIKITSKSLIEKIEFESANREITLDEIAEIANEITIEALSFTTNRVSNNPNELINSKKANCVGYSAMFNSIVNHLIRKNQLGEDFVAKHQIGQLHFLGINIHPFFESSFFGDHDFNTIKNKTTGEVISVNPTVSDYLWIRKVARN